MRTSIAAATVAAGLTIGGAAGVTLFTPTTTAAQVDDTAPTQETDTSRPEPGERLAEVLAPLVADGTLTQDQSDAVVGALLEARPERHPDRHPDRQRGHHARGAFSETVTDLLGLSAEEIREQLAAGATLAEVADAQGVSEEDLVAAIVAEIETKLDEAVEAGRITEDEAADKLDEAEERVTDRVHRSFEGDRRPGRGRGPGGPGFGR